MEHLISLHDLTVEDFESIFKNLKWYDFYKVIHQDPCIF